MIDKIVRYLLPLGLICALFFFSFPQRPHPVFLSFLLSAVAILAGSSSALMLVFIILCSSFFADPSIFPSTTDLLIVSSSIIFIILARWKNIRANSIHGINQLLKTLVDYTPQPIILIDKTGVIIFATNSLKKFLGVNPRDLIGKPFIELVSLENKKKYELYLRDIVQKWKKTPMVTELLANRYDKQQMWIRCESVNLLRHKNVHSIMLILTDITERKFIDDKRMSSLSREKAARAQAEQAVRTRDEFLSVASHELRTPLTTILLQLQTTLRRTLTQSLANFSGEKLVSSLKIAEAQSQRLKLLIRDLLNTSLVSTGRLELNPEKIDLKHIVTSVMKSLESTTKGENKIIIEDTSKKPIIGVWDAIRLEQCITNLVTNALKYGKKQPITISISSDDKTATVAVKDKGVGIASEDLARIFEPFVRGAHKNEIKGLGVGLFIANRVAEAHGGKITVKSKIDEGSTFILSLPLSSGV